MDLVLRNSNADGHGKSLITDRYGQSTDLFTESLCLFGCCFYGAMRQYDQEFLPTITPDRIGMADVLAQFPRQTAQHLVTDRMTMGIVDLLEVINIQHRNG